MKYLDEASQLGADLTLSRVKVSHGAIDRLIRCSCLSRFIADHASLKFSLSVQPCCFIRVPRVCVTEYLGTLENRALLF